MPFRDTTFAVSQDRIPVSIDNEEERIIRSADIAFFLTGMILKIIREIGVDSEEKSVSDNIYVFVEESCLTPIRFVVGQTELS